MPHFEFPIKLRESSLISEETQIANLTYSWLEVDMAPQFTTKFK